LNKLQKITLVGIKSDPVYPRLHHDKKRSTKLTLNEVQEIQRDFPNNPNITLFAEKYNVSRHTIKWWVDPEWRKKKMADNMRRLKEKMKDSVYKKHYNKMQQESRNILLENPDNRKYARFANKQSRKKNIVYYLQKSRIYHIKNKEHEDIQKKEYRSRPEVKERIKQVSKQYYDENKDKIDKRNREYYEKNRDKVLQRCKIYKNKKKLQK
jgi:hypothetical protein